MKKILLITDLVAGSAESAVEGIFRRELRRTYEVDLVFQDPAAVVTEKLDDAIVIPKRALRSGLAVALRPLTDVARYDFIIVRNKYPALQQVLRWPGESKVGFWESFPHSYRRVEEAQQEQRSVWRKKIEHAWRKRIHGQLLCKVDFYLPITARHQQEFFPKLCVPSHPLTMGVDEDVFRHAHAREIGGPLRFVYIGTIDRLRDVEQMNTAFVQTPGDFVLDYYTFSNNASVAAIQACGDSRIRVHPALPRAKLFKTIANADVGVCFVPETPTYIGSSPTKTWEYCALGLTVIVNELPDYRGLLDKQCAFLTPLDGGKIRLQLERILATPRSTLIAYGQECMRRTHAQRSYRVLARQLAQFLEEL